MFIGGLQDLYISLLSPWIPYTSRIPEKWRLRLITACFMADIVLFGIVRYVLRRESYFYNTTLGIFLMITIAVLSINGELKRVRWHRSMWITWFGMCIAFTVSDAMVPKKVCGLGIILALVFTGVFFVWQNNTRRDLLWECFKRSLRYAFWIMAAISFLFRPVYEGGRYAGIFTNPNTFGLYLVVIAAVFLSDLDWDVATGKYWYRCLPTHISIALIVFYLSMTQARTSMVTCAILGIMWIAVRIKASIKRHIWRSFLKNIGLCLAVTVILFPVFRVSVTYLPWIIGHPIIFDGEALYLSDGSKINDLGETVIAEPDVDAESLIDGYMPAAKVETGAAKDGETSEIPPGFKQVPGSRYAKDTDAPEKPIVPQNVMERFWYLLENTKGLNALTTGRIDIYKGYYKQLNFKGHANVSLTINGSKKAHAHNNWLQFGYTYGYFGMMFYGIMTVLAVFFSIRYYKRRSRENLSFAFLIPAVCIGFVVATVTECLFLPFEVFPAFAFWFVCGELFRKNKPAGMRKERIYE